MRSKEMKERKGGKGKMTQGKEGNKKEKTS
jgi:hypothetical protein